MKTLNDDEAIRAALSSGDDKTALSMAARRRNLGEFKEAITQGWSAFLNPDFYRQIGKDPERLVAAGLSALRARFNAD
jgi:hypothetical protein